MKPSVLCLCLNAMVLASCAQILSAEKPSALGRRVLASCGKRAKAVAPENKEVKEHELKGPSGERTKDGRKIFYYERSKTDEIGRLCSEYRTKDLDLTKIPVKCVYDVVCDENVLNDRLDCGWEGEKFFFSQKDLQDMDKKYCRQDAICYI